VQRSTCNATVSCADYRPTCIEHAPKLENKQESFCNASSRIVQANAAESSAEGTTAMGRPQLVVDGNKNPLLKITGKLRHLAIYVATLSSLNYKVLGQSKQVMKQRSKSMIKLMS
jgi:hypothetical protein